MSDLATTMEDIPTNGKKKKNAPPPPTPSELKDAEPDDEV
jgi:hypothetical protein